MYDWFPGERGERGERMKGRNDTREEDKDPFTQMCFFLEFKRDFQFACSRPEQKDRISWQ
jgi:hypothetical protein